MLMVRCPNTGQALATGRYVDSATFRCTPVFFSRTHCPLCKLFDIDAVQETIAFARQAGTPYAVVFNAAPPKRQEIEVPAVASARSYLTQLEVPVWGGQITHRASFSLALGEADGVKEYTSDPCSAAEIAGLWSAIEKSVKVIHGARGKAAMHRVAA